MTQIYFSYTAQVYALNSRRKRNDWKQDSCSSGYNSGIDLCGSAFQDVVTNINAQKEAERAPEKFTMEL